MRRYINVHNLEAFLNGGKPRSSWPAYRSAKEYQRQSHGQGHDLQRQLSIINKQIQKYYQEYKSTKSLKKQIKHFERLKKLSKRAQTIATKLYERGEISSNELHTYLQAMSF